MDSALPLGSAAEHKSLPHPGDAVIDMPDAAGGPDEVIVPSQAPIEQRGAGLGAGEAKAGPSSAATVVEIPTGPQSAEPAAGEVKRGESPLVGKVGPHAGTLVGVSNVFNIAVHVPVDTSGEEVVLGAVGTACSISIAKTANGDVRVTSVNCACTNCVAMPDDVVIGWEGKSVEMDGNACVPGSLANHDAVICVVRGAGDASTMEGTLEWKPAIYSPAYEPHQCALTAGSVTLELVDKHPATAMLTLDKSALVVEHSTTTFEVRLGAGWRFRLQTENGETRMRWVFAIRTAIRRDGSVEAAAAAGTGRCKVYGIAAWYMFLALLLFIGYVTVVAVGIASLASFFGLQLAQRIMNLCGGVCVAQAHSTTTHTDDGTAVARDSRTNDECMQGMCKLVQGIVGYALQISSFISHWVSMALLWVGVRCFAAVGWAWAQDISETLMNMNWEQKYFDRTHNQVHHYRVN